MRIHRGAILHSCSGTAGRCHVHINGGPDLVGAGCQGQALVDLPVANMLH